METKLMLHGKIAIPDANEQKKLLYVRTKTITAVPHFLPSFLPRPPHLQVIPSFGFFHEKKQPWQFSFDTAKGAQPWLFTFDTYTA